MALRYLKISSQKYRTNFRFTMKTFWRRIIIQRYQDSAVIYPVYTGARKFCVIRKLGLNFGKWFETARGESFDEIEKVSLCKTFQSTSSRVKHQRT